MSGSINKVILIGNVGKDPEIRRTQDGRPIANISLATSETWRDKNSGERNERREWHRISVFNEGLCRVVEQYVRKGMKLYIEGQLQTRKWTDNDGEDKYSTEVVLNGYGGVLTMLDRPTQKEETKSINSYAAATGRNQPPSDMNDDIPF